MLFLFLMTGISSAAGVKVVPSAWKVSPGEIFHIDIVAENIPADGLGAVQFRLSVDAPGSAVTGISDIPEGKPSDISIVTPLVTGIPLSGRSGIGEFFHNATGPHGILIMDNENFSNGQGLYSFSHTNGSIPPEGSGSVARFYFAVGTDASAETIHVALSEVMLLESGADYPLELITGAAIELRCMTTVPNLLGLSEAAAQIALQNSNLKSGNIYEIDNPAGKHALNTVLVQSYTAGTSVLCETPVDLAINTPPSAVGDLKAVDKSGDENGSVILSWTPSVSDDTAGYRVYHLSGTQVMLNEITSPSVTGTEVAGLRSGESSLLKVTAFDIWENENQGAVISATPIDDVAPRISIAGVTSGAFYASNVHPVITIQDTNLSSSQLTLNDFAYGSAAISEEGHHILKVIATDSSGNSTTEQVSFTIDKTPPVISVAGIEKGRFYNTDLHPMISVSDVNLLEVDALLNGAGYTSGNLISSESNYELKITAVDKAGHTTTDTYTFSIDKTLPSSSMDIGPPKFESDGNIYVSGSSLITLSGADQGTVASGIEKIEYRSNGAAWKIYQVPFVLAEFQDGTVVLDYRAVDMAGNIEKYRTVTVQADNAPPVTIFDASPKYTGSDGMIYARHDTEITLTAKDGFSGVAKTEYRIGSGAWTPYAPFSINQEGNHTVFYRSTDNLGNVETGKSTTVVIDNTPPITEITQGDPKYMSADGFLYVTEKTIFTVLAADNLSGVAKAEYRIGDGQWMPYPVFTMLGAGSYVIEFRSTDNLGNTESEKPITEITAGDPKYTYADEILYLTEKTSFTLSATDSLIGIEKTEYPIDGDQWTSYAQFTIASEGTHVIGYRSIDNLGNTETEKTLPVIIDNTPPATEITVGHPKYTGSDGTMYARQDTEITLSAADTLSGVAKVEYRIGSGAWTPYAPFNVAQEGSHTIFYRSTDNVGNLETEKSITVVIDDTPPVTKIAVGDPKYTSAEGILYMMANTTVTLSATDNLSGVAKTEYRIDGGQWTPYAKFTIASEGSHISDYRSIDNLGNAETEKTLTVIIDNTPPVTEITVEDPKYQTAENLYVSAATEISLAATDSGSGVNLIEYSMDGGDYVTFSRPITLAGYTNGGHTINYRSKDNLGNIEETKSLSVILDKTPPETSISASGAFFEGIANMVDPNTIFMLHAVDELSGVNNIQYRIDGDIWKTYTAGFSISGFPAGEHTISYKATDNVLNEETPKTITVKLVIIEVAKGLNPEPVVLAGPRKSSDQQNGKGQQDSQNAMKNLSNILAASGLDHYIPETADDFKAALRSGRYNTFVLADMKDERITEELREAVHYGAGMVFIKTIPNEDPGLDDLFGVKISGKTSSAGLPVYLLESEISGEDILKNSGKALSVKIITGTVGQLGYVTEKQKTYPVILANEYGRGRVVLYAFDLLNNSDQSRVKDLLFNSIDFVAPEEAYVLPLDSLPIQLSIQNSSQPVELVITETIAAKTTVDSIMPRPDYTEAASIIWQSLFKADEEKTFGYYLNLPDIRGDYTLNTKIVYSNNGVVNTYGSYDLTLNLPYDSNGLLDEIISELGSVVTTDIEASEAINEAVGMLYSIKTNALTPEDAEKNIRWITEAIESVRRVSFDLSEIRIKLDELLRIWQKKWYLLGE